MNAKEEQLSLRDNPLPPEPITREPGDELLPSRILDLDKQIADYENGIALAREAREHLIKRAITLNIGNDDKAIIIVKETLADREIDVARLKIEKPDIYEKAKVIEVAAEYERIQKKIDALRDVKMENPIIRIATLKPMLREDDITTLSLPRKITRTYQVLKAGTPLPKGKGIKLLSE